MPREKWTWVDTVLVVVFIILAALLTGTWDYATTLESDAMAKELRPRIWLEHLRKIEGWR